ncbi:MAG: hypothetical protein ACJ8AS_00685 [Hyphomicrobiales bacterium]
MDQPRTSILNPAVLLALAIGITGGGPAADAQSLDTIGTTAQKCTTLNCKSLQQTGQLNGYGGNTNPWVELLAKSPGRTDCLRIDVTQQSTDLAMSVVAPDGTVYTDDDGGSCSLCPRVVVPKSAIGGIYTVVIGRYDGSAIESSFTVNSGKYKPASNPNCANPTPGTGPSSAAKRIKSK